MRTILFKLSFFIIATLLFSCKKDNIKVKEGVYKGTFTVTYSSGVHSGETILELKNRKFSCSGNSNRFPAGGSGTYALEGDKITFKDENFWTAEFDSNLVLDGQYVYTINGKNLKISADKNGVGHYEYNLEKQ